LLAHAMRAGRAADYRTAHTLARASLDLLEAHGKGDSAQAASGWNTMSVASRRLGETALARDEIQASIDIRRRLLGERHPLVSHALINLGTVELDEARYREALSDFEHALTDLEASTGPVTADTAMLHNNLGIARVRLRDLDQARVEFERAAVIGAEVFGDHPSTALYVMNLGDLDREVRRPKEALLEYARAAGILGRGKSPDAHTLARILGGRGQAELDAGDAASAKASLTEALALFDGGKFDPSDRADVEFALARALTALGQDKGRAGKLAESARAIYETSGDRHREDLEAMDRWLASRSGRRVD
jgi:tetratricopeptide (TPR) repeat protein